MPKLTPKRSHKYLISWVNQQISKGVKRARIAVGGVPNLYLNYQAAASVDGQPSNRGYTTYSYRKQANARFPQGREIGLGSFDDVSLAEARDKARKLMVQFDAGIDPIEVKRSEQAKLLAEVCELEKLSHTFGEVAQEYMHFMSKAGAWKNNAKGELQADSRLRLHILPTLGKRPVATISSKDVAELFNNGSFNGISSMSNKCRALIRDICTFAQSKGFRPHNLPDPTDLKALRFMVEPGKADRQEEVPQPSLSYEEIPEFFSWLMGLEYLGARALAFLILTGGRMGQVRHWSESNEIRGARWSQIDLEEQTWSIRAPEMKTGKYRRRPYVCPLSTAAVELLKAQPRVSCCDFVFPGGSGRICNKPVSGTAIRQCIKYVEIASGRLWVDRVQTEELGRPVRIVPHGFRATFSTWANSPRNIRVFSGSAIERVLDHALDDPLKYRRADYDPLLFDETRAVLEAWGRYCTTGLWPDEPDPK